MWLLLHGQVPLSDPLSKHASTGFHVILGRGISRRGRETSQIEIWLLVLLLLVCISEAGGEEAHIVAVKILTHHTCLPQMQNATRYLFTLHYDGLAAHLESTTIASLVALVSEHHLGPADDQGCLLQRCNNVSNTWSPCRRIVGIRGLL